MLRGLPKMLNIVVCQLVISYCNQGFHMAFDRGHIWLSYDPHCLSICIEIRIFWANGPFKYFLPRTSHISNILSLTHLSVRRRLLAAPGVVIPPSSSSQPSSRSSSEALAPSPGLRYGSIGAAATPTSPSTGDTDEGRDPSRRCCSRSSAEIDQPLN